MQLGSRQRRRRRSLGPLRPSQECCETSHGWSARLEGFAGGLAGLAEKGLSKLLKLLPPSPIPDPPKKPAPAEAPAAPEP